MLRAAAGSTSDADEDFRLPGFDFLREVAAGPFLAGFCPGGR